MRTKPKHNRAKNTVKRIMDSAINALKKCDFNEVTTTMIAEDAFISIGTLYNYFPDKESIYQRLYESTASECATVIRKVVLDNIEVSLEKSLPTLIDTMLELHLVHENILIKLADQNPTLIKDVQYLAVDNLVRQTNHLYLRTHAEQFQSPSLEPCEYFLIRNVIVESIRRYILEERESINRDIFVHETATLVYCYLRYRNEPMK